MKILVAVKRGEQQADALALAEQLAGDAGELVVANAYRWEPGIYLISDDYEDVIKQDARQIVASAGEQLGQPSRPLVVSDDTAAHGLVRAARGEHSDALVIGSCHRTGVSRAILGGTAERVLHDAPCPVIVAPRGYAQRAAEIRRVGVAFDGGAEARAAARWAGDFARQAGATLQLVAVLEPRVPAYPNAAAAYAELFGSEREALRRRLDETLAELPDDVRPTGRLLEGRAAARIAEASDEYDFLVMGSRGYGRIGRVFLGGVARGVLAEARCPVVVIPRSAAQADAEADRRVASQAA